MLNVITHWATASSLSDSNHPLYRDTAPLPLTLSLCQFGIDTQCRDAGTATTLMINRVRTPVRTALVGSGSSEFYQSLTTRSRPRSWSRSRSKYEKLEGSFRNAKNMRKIWKDRSLLWKCPFITRLPTQAHALLRAPRVMTDRHVQAKKWYMYPQQQVQQKVAVQAKKWYMYPQQQRARRLSHR